MQDLDCGADCCCYQLCIDECIIISPSEQQFQEQDTHLNALVVVVPRGVHERRTHRLCTLLE